MFVDGARVAIVGTLCHHLDMGGMAAGSYAANATEIFQEGLRIPPMRLVRRGRLNAEVLAMMRQNVRRPDMLWGDLQAQLASLAVGEANLAKLAAALRRGHARRGLRPHPRRVGGGDARHDRPHAGWPLRVRGLHRR